MIRNHHLAFFLLAVLTRGCPTQHQISTCTFYVSYTNSQCSSFSFRNCSYQLCTNSGENCSNYQTKWSTSWSLCTEKCCKDDKYFSKTSQGISECMYEDSEGVSLTLGQQFIIAMSVCSIVVIGSILACCYLRRNRTVEVINHVQNPVQYPTRIIYCHCPATPFEQSWIPQPNQKPVLDNTCSICLDDRPTLQLPCGHLYHRCCIISYMQRKTECGLCRSNNFDNVRVYCQGCFSFVFESSLIAYQRQLTTGDMICTQCNSIQNSAIGLFTIQKVFP